MPFPEPTPGAAPTPPTPPASPADPAVAQLAARWVRWVAAHRRPADPIADRRGRHAGHHQPADVWFLAGTYGGSAQRSCVVPAGRALFFPAFSWWQVDPGAGPAEPVSDATGHAQLDGVPVPLAPAGSPEPFKVRGFFNNIVTTWPWPVPVSCWGLWGLVAPPAPGRHELTFGGTDGGRFWVEAQYLIEVR